MGRSREVQDHGYGGANVYESARNASDGSSSKKKDIYEGYDEEARAYFEALDYVYESISMSSAKSCSKCGLELVQIGLFSDDCFLHKETMTSACPEPTCEKCGFGMKTVFGKGGGTYVVHIVSGKAECWQPKEKLPTATAIKGVKVSKEPLNKDQRFYLWLTLIICASVGLTTLAMTYLLVNS